MDINALIRDEIIEAQNELKTTGRVIAHVTIIKDHQVYNRIDLTEIAGQGTDTFFRMALKIANLTNADSIVIIHDSDVMPLNRVDEKLYTNAICAEYCHPGKPMVVWASLYNEVTPRKFDFGPIEKMEVSESEPSTTVH